MRSFGPGGNEGAFIPTFPKPPVTLFKALFLLLPSALMSFLISFLPLRSCYVKKTPRENVELVLLER